MLLFDEMKRRGFQKAVVQIAPDNTASIALHRSMGFALTQRTDDALLFEYRLGAAD